MFDKNDRTRRRYEGYYEGASGRKFQNEIDEFNHVRHGHFGKGPKGYTRSQDKIYHDVCEALMQSSDVDASDVEVSVNEGIVTLTGTVESRRVKRIAEEVVENILGVEDVMNMLSMRGEPKGKQIDESGSALGGNPNQESKTGHWPPPSH